MTSVSLENGEAGLTCVAWVLSSPSMQSSRHPPKDAIVSILGLGIWKNLDLSMASLRVDFYQCWINQ